LEVGAERGEIGMVKKGDRRGRGDVGEASVFTYVDLWEDWIG